MLYTPCSAPPRLSQGMDLFQAVQEWKSEDETREATSMLRWPAARHARFPWLSLYDNGLPAKKLVASTSGSSLCESTCSGERQASLFR